MKSIDPRLRVKLQPCLGRITLCRQYASICELRTSPQQSRGLWARVVSVQSDTRQQRKIEDGLQLICFIFPAQRNE